jgi:hypothetical protein
MTLLLLLYEGNKLLLLFSLVWSVGVVFIIVGIHQLSVCLCRWVSLDTPLKNFRGIQPHPLSIIKLMSWVI